MATTSKTFDCIEMKRQLQKRLIDDYEAHKEDFPSFEAFVRERARKSERVQSIRKQLGLSC